MTFLSDSQISDFTDVEKRASRSYEGWFIIKQQSNNTRFDDTLDQFHVHKHQTSA